MRLSANLLNNFANINQFSSTNQWEIRSGELNVLYFQLVDLDQDSLRYLPGIGVSNQPFGVFVKFPSIDDAQILNLTASQVDPADNSIWKVTLSASQTPKSGNVIFTITEGSNSRSFKVLNALSVEFTNNGSC